MSLPLNTSTSGEYSEKVMVVGRPRPDDLAAAPLGKRKAPYEPCVHLQPSKVVLKETDDRRYVLAFCSDLRASDAVAKGISMYCKLRQS